MSLKPTSPQTDSPAERERYRKDMAAYYTTPEAWGWVGSHGPKPAPGKCEGCGQSTYPEHGKAKHLSDGSKAGKDCAPVKVPDPPAIDPPVTVQTVGKRK